jgi:transposase
MNSMTIAVDVAKAVFEVAVSEHPGQVQERHRCSRERFRRYLGEQPPATILMEACGSAHYWGRPAQTRGHQVVLLPPHAVRPYVLRNKTDRTDAKGRLEAVRNDEARPVPVKSETQQAVAALHRLRSTWLATRTARINTVRAPLREFGVVIPMGARHVVPTLGTVLEDADAGVPRLLRPVLAEAARERCSITSVVTTSRSARSARPSSNDGRLTQRSEPVHRIGSVHFNAYRLNVDEFDHGAIRDPR